VEQLLLESFKRLKGLTEHCMLQLPALVQHAAGLQLPALVSNQLEF
jgi:hypothetical protein